MLCITQDQFWKCSNVRFPETIVGNITVSEDRTTWSCVICPHETKDFVHGNVLRHYLTEKHRKNWVVKHSTSRAFTRAVDQEHAGWVCKEKICEAVIDDAVITSARKSLPFTAVPLMLDHTARALNAVAGHNLK